MGRGFAASRLVDAEILLVYDFGVEFGAWSEFYCRNTLFCLLIPHLRIRLHLFACRLGRNLAKNKRLDGVFYVCLQTGFGDPIC